jgi:hypothetical protein
METAEPVLHAVKSSEGADARRLNQIMAAAAIKGKP